MGENSLTGTELGDYRIGRLIGRGGMGEVYEAVDQRRGRTVALKVLGGALAGDEGFRQRFLRESRAAARINNPHVITIHDFGDVDGRLFLDMRLIDGSDLSALLATDGAMAPQRAIAIVEQIADAIDSAHAEGLIHRDVKPDNILVDHRDRAYLVDFGLAQAAGDTRLTSTGSAIGSFAYMAPERFGTDDSGPAVDIYALACVLYECLSGRRPFDVTSFEQYVAAHLHQPPPVMGNAFDPVIARGMAKAPADRYASAGDLVAAAWTVIDDAGPGPAAPIAPVPAAPAPHPYQPTVSGPARQPTRDISAGGHFSEPHGAQPYDAQPYPSPPTRSGSRTGLLIGAGAAAVVVLIAVAALLGWALGSDSDPASEPVAQTSAPAAPTSDAPSSAETAPSTPPPPTSEATVTQTAAPPPPASSRPAGDLGLSVPMSRPACDGSAVLMVHNAVTPGQYESDTQQALNQFPGASYLRSDQSCASLRDRDDNGNVIYAVYYPGGSSLDSACALSRSRGLGGYAKFLDNSSDPAFSYPC